MKPGAGPRNLVYSADSVSALQSILTLPEGFSGETRLGLPSAANSQL
ncbi:hypothetical protein [Paenibacillus sp. P36]